VTVAYLASRETQVQARYLAALITIPTIGLIWLIIGLRERSPGRPQTSPYSLRYPMAPPRRKVGQRAHHHRYRAVLSGLGILGNSAHAASRHAEVSRHDNRFATDTSMRVGERLSKIAYLGRVFVSQLRL
jgi:hypothetical protein